MLALPWQARIPWQAPPCCLRNTVSPAAATHRVPHPLRGAPGRRLLDAPGRGGGGQRAAVRRLGAARPLRLPVGRRGDRGVPGAAGVPQRRHILARRGHLAAARGGPVAPPRARGWADGQASDDGRPSVLAAGRGPCLGLTLCSPCGLCPAISAVWPPSLSGSAIQVAPRPDPPCPPLPCRPGRLLQPHRSAGG